MRVIEAPKSGILTVRRAVVTAGRIAGCHALKIPVQVVSHWARGDYGDRATSATRSANGDVGAYDATIDVKAVPKKPAPGLESPTRLHEPAGAHRGQVSFRQSGEGRRPMHFQCRGLWFNDHETAAADEGEAGEPIARIDQ
jgi:hypothetical protein